LLNQVQIDQYQRDGYLIFRNLFSEQEVQELRDAMAGLLRSLGRSDRSADTGFDPWFREDGGGDALNPNRVIYLNDLHLRHARLDQHMRSPQLMSIFCDLWGTDIKAFQVASVIKPNEHNSEYRGWHQDMPDYVPLSDDRNACAITYLGEMGPETGGTSLVPATHKSGLPKRTYETVQGWPEKLKRRSMAGFDEATADVVAPDFHAGDVVVFHSSLYHKANNNADDISKIGLINVYMAQDCYDVESRNEFRAADLPITRNGTPLTATETNQPQ
jgi:phytanoyl-CoA hydroxylase